MGVSVVIVCGGGGGERKGGKVGPREYFLNGIMCNSMFTPTGDHTARYKL